MEVLLAFLGLVFALISGYFAGRRSSRLEREKEARLAVAAVTKGIAVAIHSMCWLTWKAVHRPQHLQVADADAYDRDMHMLYPDLVGALSQVSALDNRIYLKLRTTVEEVYSLDEEVATAATALYDGRDNAAQGIAALYKQVRAMETTSKERVADIMSAI